MKRFAKAVRILTIAPIMASSLFAFLFLNNGNIFNSALDMIIGILCIAIIPTLAYFIQRKYVVFKDDMRTAERKLAIIFSLVSYTIVLIYALVAKTKDLYKIMVLTYFLSGLLVFLFAFVLKKDASGHMCGVSGPIALLVYVYGYWYSFLFLLLIVVGWASRYLNRHTFRGLITGALIPIISLIISILII